MSRIQTLCSNCPQQIERGNRRACVEPTCRASLCINCFRRCRTCDHCARSAADWHGGETQRQREAAQANDLKKNTKITQFFKKRITVTVNRKTGARTAETSTDDAVIVERAGKRARK